MAKNLDENTINLQSILFLIQKLSIQIEMLVDSNNWNLYVDVETLYSLVGEEGIFCRSFKELDWLQIEITSDWRYQEIKDQ